MIEENNEKTNREKNENFFSTIEKNKTKRLVHEKLNENFLFIRQLYNHHHHHHRMMNDNDNKTTHIQNHKHRYTHTLE